MIEIQGLSFRFRDSQAYALRDVNLRVAPGEFLVITGPSGCGKSTLALAIGGYLFRQYEGDADGRVIVSGIDARESPVYDVAEIVGLVQQNPEAQFCTLTVEDEIAFGLENRCLPRSEIQGRIAWSLDIVGAGHLATRALATLSGGERQKVAIAAVMAAKPLVLIFDEPTSNLDPAATSDIFDVIEHIRARAGITVIVIEHKLGYLQRFAPRLVAMDGGSIVYDGEMRERDGDAFEAGLGASISPPSLSATQPLARVSHLTAAYDDHPVLRDVSLEICSGELVAVMGANGSGKTTLLQCLMGLIRPNGGRVEVLGHDARHAPVSHIARQVGFVFQNPDHQLFSDSIWGEATFAADNLRMLDGSARGRIRELLVQSGLDGRLDEHPYRLSYGQKRRLNLISILGYGPQLILLDEVLIGQDPTNARFLLDLLRERTLEGDAVVLVNHAPAVTRRYASRIVFLDGGRVLVDAPLSEAQERLSALGRGVYVT